MSKLTKNESVFGKNLKQLMKEHKLTIRKAAQVAGVSQGTIGDWQSGTAPTNYAAVLRLARFLNVPLVWLLTGEQEQISLTPRVEDVLLEGALIFDGIAKIQIQQLIPKKGTKNELE